MLCKPFRLLFLFSLASASCCFQFTENLATDCLVTLGDEVYDLCPLARAPQRIAKYEQSDEERSTFVLSVGKESHILKSPSSNKCLPGTWICMIATDRSQEAPRQVRIIASFAAERSQVPGEDLHVLSISRISQSAHIVFICDYQAHSQSSPDLIGESNGILLFSWPTSYACSQAVPPHGFTVTEEDTTPGEEDQKKETDDPQELIQLPISKSRLRSAAAIIFLTICGLIGLGYLVYSPPPRIRRFFSAYVGPIRFRVGEGRLVQWAQEDMGFLDDEVDVMVNGNLDEQIPLKPSPRINRSFTNYGSA